MFISENIYFSSFLMGNVIRYTLSWQFCLFFAFNVVKKHLSAFWIPLLMMGSQPLIKLLFPCMWLILFLSMLSRFLCICVYNVSRYRSFFFLCEFFLSYCLSVKYCQMWELLGHFFFIFSLLHADMLSVTHITLRLHSIIYIKKNSFLFY